MSERKEPRIHEAEFAAKNSRQATPESEDPILQLRGFGKKIWVGETPDDYVRRLREGRD